MTITIIGTGYVGLVTGACFSDVGINVYCIDIDSDKIELLKQGISPIYEPDLDNLLKRNIDKKRLNFSTNLSEHINNSDIIFIAVGTPSDEDGSADLQYVLNVATEIGKSLNKHLIVVTKSTVPVGTSELVKKTIANELEKRNLNIAFDIASNPEFLKEGDAINDFMKPDRIVIGVETENAKNILSELYKPFTLNGHPIIFMDIASSELTKYVANAMLATKISFMNDVANLCEKVNADVNKVRIGIGSDSRIGNKFIYPGIGYGGSCFPKDVKALIKTADNNNYSMRILKAVEAVNYDQKLILYEKIKHHFNGNLEGKKVAIWGLSFKPQTDDIREAPSIVIIENLIKNGCEISAYDPVATEEAKIKLKHLNNIVFENDIYKTVENADALMLITEWSEFRLPNWDIIFNSMKSKIIFDGRNIFDANKIVEQGFTYYSIGNKVKK